VAGLWTAAVSPDGNRIAVSPRGGNRPVRVWAVNPDNKKPAKKFTNSIGMKFVWIPPGTFLMGSPKEEKLRGEDETQHKITLTKGFYMGVYTVTQEQWQVVMGRNPSHFKGEKNLPVETVSWDDCQEFIKRLRETDKKRYRLPTEAEWEYCCRAGTTTPFHFGATISADQANYFGKYVYGNGKKGVFRAKTTPVGSFPANAWGLHDMHGNVLQWCQDWHGDYPRKEIVDPQGPDGGQNRGQRGGSFDFSPQSCRSACRQSVAPGIRGRNIGFRLCFCADQQESICVVGSEPYHTTSRKSVPLHNGTWLSED
jgi:formylglycine-generating enzyme required for sulfatase activity